MNSQKGFTLIELLVVIAIIGILAAIVLVSLQGAPARAKDARIQSDIDQVRTQAALMWTETGVSSYATLCDATDHTLNDSISKLKTIEDDLKGQQGTLSVSCYGGTDAYCVSAKLISKDSSSNSTQYFCVDATGHAGITLTTDPCDDTNKDCLP